MGLNVSQLFRLLSSLANSLNRLVKVDYKKRSLWERRIVIGAMSATSGENSFLIVRAVCLPVGLEQTLCRIEVSSLVRSYH